MWKRRIEKDIQKIREEISILAEILQGRRAKEKKRRALMRKYKFKSNDDIPPVTEKLKQQLLANYKFQRIRRFEKRRKFYSQNKMFKEKTKDSIVNLGKTPSKYPSHAGKKLLRTSGLIPGRKKSVIMREQSG